MRRFCWRHDFNIGERGDFSNEWVRCLITRLYHYCIAKGTILDSSLSSLLWRPAQLYFGEKESKPKNRRHYYSSWQLTYTFKTCTKHTKTHIAVFISAAVLSAAAKLRGLALCAFINFFATAGSTWVRTFRKLPKIKSYNFQFTTQNPVFESFNVILSLSVTKPDYYYYHFSCEHWILIR